MEREDINRLYDRHARELVGFFVRRTGDPQLALDLLSETFLAAFEQRDRCRARDERQAAAWVFAIAANMLSAQYRRRGSERRATERLALHVRALTEHELDVAARLAGGGESESLTAAFAAISDDQREAIQLRVVDERGYGAVSEVLEISEPAARARVSRGLRALRRAIASPRGSGE